MRPYFRASLFQEWERGRNTEVEMKQDGSQRTCEKAAQAITVDWIVVTTSLIGLGIVVIAAIQSGDGVLISQVSQTF